MSILDTGPEAKIWQLVPAPSGSERRPQGTETVAPIHVVRSPVQVKQTRRPFPSTAQCARMFLAGAFSPCANCHSPVTTHPHAPSQPPLGRGLTCLRVLTCRWSVCLFGIFKKIFLYQEYKLMVITM